MTPRRPIFAQRRASATASFTKYNVFILLKNEETNVYDIQENYSDLDLGDPTSAFFFPEGEGWRLRWFSPLKEIDLCGHATVATAFVITEFLDRSRREMNFETRSGPLSVSRKDDVYVLDFPVRNVTPSSCATSCNDSPENTCNSIT